MQTFDSREPAQLDREVFWENSGGAGDDGGAEGSGLQGTEAVHAVCAARFKRDLRRRSAVWIWSEKSETDTRFVGDQRPDAAGSSKALEGGMVSSSAIQRARSLGRSPRKKHAGQASQGG